LLISIISIINNKKNAITPIIGGFVLIGILIFSDKLTLNKDRFNALKSVFGTESVQTDVIREGSRTETWALYYDQIFERPFLGHGFMKFQRRRNGMPGVHNSFLMIIGEAGILPFLWMLGIYGYLLAKSFTFFKTRPEFFYISLAIVLSLMTGHQYFRVFYYVFLSMFVYYKLNELSLEENSTLTLTKYGQLS
jgi:O-antigen ligase